MNVNDEPCLELNEIIYRIAGEFWKQAYYSLMSKQKIYEPVSNLSGHNVIGELQKEIKLLAKENNLKFSAYSYNEHFYITLIPYRIYIEIENELGDFSISTPHINTRHFTYTNYKAGLNWIQDYIDIDIKPLTEKIEAVRENFYLNTKLSEIATESIKSLCDSILGKKYQSYKLHQSHLISSIIFQADDKSVYEIEIYHKPFSEDASFLIDILNNPREVQIANKLNCSKLLFDRKGIKAILKNKKMLEAII